MSRSYRQPFAAVTGTASAKIDKQMAARGARRTQNNYTKLHWEDEDFLVPHRLECTHNEVYSWGRDGHQRYEVPDQYEWSFYCLVQQGFTCFPPDHHFYGVWPRPYHTRITRK